MWRDQRRTHRPIWFGIVGLLIVGGSWSVWILFSPDSNETTRPDHQPATVENLDIPPISPSRFLNAGSDATYVGNAACVECHTGEHDSYLQTPHSRALGEIDLSVEPPDAEFEHALSGRTYRVYRKDNELWHRESITTADGEVLVLADYPMQYAIGSGHHSRSYLVEIDGFLIESPLTWYAKKQAWAMSPGFDRPVHRSFERAADVGCVSCHAGRIESIDNSLSRLKIHQAAVGCESCHGPGSSHVKQRTATSEVSGDIDWTIVNPRRLARDENESICAQCHLRTNAAVLLRGREIGSFRPGMSLNEFRIDYVLKVSDDADDSMSVTGHVEQMRMSACYRQSETLTCTTCHNPHSKPASAQRVDYYRQKCLSCHAANGCGLLESERLRKNSEDNCIACHMPQVSTDIAHFVFTHHRIGLHKANPPAEPDTKKVGVLVAFQDVSHLSKVERERGLGLAYQELSDKQFGPETDHAYRTRALNYLSNVRNAGLRDPEVDAALAKIYWINESRQAVPLGESALKLDRGNLHLSHGARVNTLFILADSYLRNGQSERALSMINQLVRLRLTSEDWLMLGLSRDALGETAAAIEALKRAIRINRARPDLNTILAELYGRAGHKQLMEYHIQHAAKLKRLAK